MKNKKGFMSVGVAIAVVAALGVVAAGLGYAAYKKTMPSVKVGPNGVEVNTGDVSVKTGTNGVNLSTRANGINMNIDGTNGVNLSTGVNEATGGVDISVNDNEVNLNASGINVQNNNQSENNTKISTVLIFDASGSMAVRSQGDSRINIAKNALAKYVDKLGENVNLSVVVYGHKGNNTQAGKAESCRGIEEVYYMGPVNKSIVTSKINSLQPNGWTPITDSLKKAKFILDKNDINNKKYVVLLSDGKETCGGDPIAYAKQLCEDGIVVDVIGLDVSGVTASQLENISINGCGEYYSVNDAADFSAAIDKMGIKINTGNVKLNVGANGVNVQTGNVNIQTNDNGAKIDAGNVHLDTTGNSPEIDIPGVSIPSF